MLPPEGGRHRRRLQGMGTAPNLSPQGTWTMLSAGFSALQGAGSHTWGSLPVPSNLKYCRILCINRLSLACSWLYTVPAARKSSGAKKKEKKNQCTGCRASASPFFTPLLVLMLPPCRHDLKAKNLPKNHFLHIIFTRLKAVAL